jgi:hypothetical protein
MNIQDAEKLVEALRSIQVNMGIYPAAVQGCGEHDYEQRDGYKNGWNACIMEYGVKLDKAIFDASEPWSTPERLFSADDGYTFRFNSEEGWLVSLGDTWYYACADDEPIPPAAYNEVLNWYHDYGRAGVLYWVYLQRKEMPRVPRAAKLVRAIEVLVKKPEVEMKLRQYPPLRFAWAIFCWATMLYAAGVMGFLVGYGPPFRSPALMAVVGCFMFAFSNDVSIRDRWRELQAWSKARRTT